MKTAILRTVATLSFSMVLASVCSAATVNPADTPLTNTVDPDVKPTIMFILDDSGSMGWEYMPDTVNTNKSKRCYRNSYYNRVYFEPSRAYALPLDSTGATWSYVPTFTSARANGFDSTSSVVNISTKFRAGSDSTDQEAYYYKYTGVSPATPVKGVCYPDTSYTLVQIKTLTAADQQNFANWYSFYRTRLLMMKSAITLAFKGVDDQFRLGYMSINNNTGSDFLNPVVFDAAGRAAWYDKIIKAKPNSGTGLRWALSTAGQLFGNKLTGKTWFSSGITITDPVKYSCQQNLTILSTDGFWNQQLTGLGCSNHEGCYLDGSKMGDTDGALPPPYKDANKVAGTLADVASYYFSTDLRPELTDNVFPISSFNDTNKFQHMNTFTIGLGVSGTLVYNGYPYERCTDGCDYPKLAANPQTKTWPTPIADSATAIDDLWHAAVNGHGLYFGAQEPDDLIDGLNKIVAGLPRSGAGGAAAVGNQVATLGDGVYLAGFKTVEWTGDLQKFEIIDDDTAGVSSTAAWSAQTKLDARLKAGDDRKIYFAKDGALAEFNPTNLVDAKTKKWFNVDGSNPNGKLDQYPFFTAAQIAAATPDSLISYLRGQNALEDAVNDINDTSVTKLYRGRVHMLGDIVNSASVYVQKPVFDYQDNDYSVFKKSMETRAGVVYVGANDGMLHAFSAADGSELWAFVPTAVIPYLYKLADKNYAGQHRFFVDGPVTISDVYFGGAWHTVLIGALGKGGKSLFALDITNPSAPKLLWEFSVSSDIANTCANTLSPTTTVCDADLGYTFGNAVTTRVSVTGDEKDTQWVALFASGYDNTTPGDQAARLYMVNIADASSKKEFSTSGGTDPSQNGIAWINGWNDDGMRLNYVRHVYAGDLGGRIWRFDLKAGTATLMTTLGSSGKPQPVTTRIELGDFGNDVSKRVLYVGTGRYLTYGDVTNKDTQSIYAIRDTAASTTYPIGGATYFHDKAARLVTSGSNRMTSFTYNNVTTNPYGWYMDFDAESGERVTQHPRIFGANQANLVVATNVPVANKCDIGGTGYLYILNSQPASATTVLAADTVSKITGAMVVGATMMTTTGGAQRVVVTRSDGTLEVVGSKPVTYGSNVRRVFWRELRN